MWTQNKLFQPQKPQPGPICTCVETGTIGCPIHDIEVSQYPITLTEIRNKAIEQCAIVAADWFTVAPRYRTKARLIQMILDQKKAK